MPYVLLFPRLLTINADESLSTVILNLKYLFMFNMTNNFRKIVINDLNLNLTMPKLPTHISAYISIIFGYFFVYLNSNKF